VTTAPEVWCLISLAATQGVTIVYAYSTTLHVNDPFPIVYVIANRIKFS